jgi:hypothetical protein
MELVMKNKPRLSNTPPIREMTKQMLDTWKHIAKQEDKVICLTNGLNVYPRGGWGVDYDCSAKYEANYEYEKLMIRIYEAQNKMEFILNHQMKDFECYPSMQAILELPKESRDKILKVFTKIITKKLAENTHKENTSNGES